jgi:hypothetical protein
MVDLKEFQDPITLKEALDGLYDQLKNAGVELALVVNKEAFKRGGKDMDISAAKIKFGKGARKISVAQFLQAAISQTPAENAVLVYTSDFFEITTEEAWRKNNEGPWTALIRLTFTKQVP